VGVSNSPNRGWSITVSQIFSTMAAINITIDFPERLPSKSRWASIKRWMLDKLESFGCCGSPDQFRDLQCYRVDERARRCIRAEMREHAGFGDEETCVGEAMNSTFRSTGYDLGNLGTIRKANLGVKRTYAEWDAYFESIGVDPLKTMEGRAQIVPKFAAACALHLRAKLGALSNNEANVLLVQRKYLEICREHGVRDVDIVLHQGFVLNAVFTESVLDDISSSRRRLPAWMKFLDEIPETGSVANAVC